MDGKTVSDGIESQFEGLSLENYVLAREAYCAEYHQQPCQNCLGMLNIANTILKEGFWKMKDAFHCLAEHIQPCNVCPKKTEPMEMSKGVNQCNDQIQ